MRRRPLASAFVTTVVSSGCAWSYGGGVQYAQATDGDTTKRQSDVGA